MKFLLLFIVLFIISSMYLFPIIKMPIGVYDEGVILAGADRIQKGYVPYKHFWTIYPPGQYYIISFLFDIFGSSILIARIYDIFIKTILSLSIFSLIFNFVHSYKIALIGWAIAIIWIAQNTLVVYPVYPAILIIYLSITFFIFHIEKNNNSLICISAMLTTFCSIFRHDLAFFTAATIFIVLSVRTLFNKNKNWTPIYIYIVSFLIIGLPILFFTLKMIDPIELFSQLFLIPSEIIFKYRWLPYPPFSFGTMPFFLFPLVLLTGLIFALVQIVKYKNNDTLTYGILVISLLGVFFLNQVRVRSDIYHLLPVALNSIILIPIFFWLLLKNSTISRHWILAYIYILTFSIVFIPPVLIKFQSLIDDYYSDIKQSTILRGSYSGLSDDLENVVLYIQNSTPKNDKIYVGVKNHDQFTINHTILYYLANRDSVTRFHHFEPGVTNTINAQKTIKSELIASSPEMLILTNSYWYEPNESRFDLGIDIVDNYIREFYKLEAKFGIYEIWTQKQTAI